MTKPKYCKDCRWLARGQFFDRGDALCERPTGREQTTCLVSGMTRSHMIGDCFDQRNTTREDDPLYCGASGKYWEPLPPEQPKPPDLRVEVGTYVSSFEQRPARARPWWRFWA